MAEEVQVDKKGGKGLVIALAVVVLLLVIGMTVMAMMLMSSGDKSSDSSADQSAQIEIKPGFKQYPQPGPDAQPQYLEMKFVVNFKGEGKARFLGVDLKFMSRYPEVIVDMEHIRPILLNDITMLLRQQTYTDLSQDNGPEDLRQKILIAARAAAESNRISPELVDNVFLTRFVMQ